MAVVGLKEFIMTVVHHSVAFPTVAFTGAYMHPPNGPSVIHGISCWMAISIDRVAVCIVNVKPVYVHARSGSVNGLGGGEVWCVCVGGGGLQKVGYLWDCYHTNPCSRQSCYRRLPIRHNGRSQDRYPGKHHYYEFPIMIGNETYLRNQIVAL